MNSLDKAMNYIEPMRKRTSNVLDSKDLEPIRVSLRYSLGSATARRLLQWPRGAVETKTTAAVMAAAAATATAQDA